MMRHSSRRPDGMTLISFIMVLVIVGCIAYLAMKLFPVYNDHWAVVKAMNQVAAEPGIQNKGPEAVRESVDRKLYISYVSAVKHEHMTIDRKDGQPVLRIKYEVRDKVVANLDFVASFDDTVKLTGAGGG